MAGRLGGPGGGVDHRRRQPVQLSRRLDPHGQGRGLRQQIAAEPGGQGGEPFVDLPQADLVVRRERRPRADDVAVVAIQHAGLFGVEAEFVAAGDEVGDAGEDPGVEPDSVAVGGQPGIISASSSRSAGVDQE